MNPGEPKIKHLIEYSSALINPKKYLLSTIGYKQKSRDIEDMAFFSSDHFKGVELGLWSANFFNKKFEINKEAVNLFVNPNFEIPRFHGCFEFMFPRNKKILLNLASRDRDSIKSAKVQIQIAREISTIKKPVIVFHPGFLTNSDNRKKGIENLKRNLDEIVAFAEKKDVICTLENMPLHKEMIFIGADPEEMLKIVESFDSPNLKITFDWGHLNSFVKTKGIKDNFSFISSAIKTLGKKVIHAHLHYNKSCEKGFKVENSTFRKAQIKFASCFKSLKFVKMALSDEYDRHLPFTKISKEYQEGYGMNIRDLMEFSRISEYGYVTHEIIPKKAIKIFTVEKDGAVRSDYFKGVDFLNKIIYGKEN